MSAERPPAEPVAVLVANHAQFLAFLERRVGSRALAEDILQEAFVRGLDKLRTLRSDESAIAWFYRLLRNAVIDQQRRHGTAQRRLAAFGAELERSIDPDSEMRGVICRCIGELASTLGTDYAHALSRVEVDGQPVKDYAATLGITANNAAVRLSRAREALRRQVVRCCGSCAEHGCLDCTCAASAGPPRAPYHSDPE